MTKEIEMTGQQQPADLCIDCTLWTPGVQQSARKEVCRVGENNTFVHAC